MANKENYIKDLDACTAPVATDELYVMSNTQGDTASMKISFDTLFTNTYVCVNKTEWIDDLTVAVANGAATGTIATTNGQNIPVFDFDKTDPEYIHFSKKMPSTWFVNNDITFQVLWVSSATTGNVQWGVEAISYADGDPLDAAYGTAVEVSSPTPATANTLKFTTLANVVASGSPAVSEFLNFRIYRAAGNTSDDLDVDARLIGVKILYGACTSEET